MIIGIYVLKMLAISGILFSYYWVFLRNRRFHHFNRIFLLGIVITSISLPLVTLHVPLEKNSSPSSALIQTLEVVNGSYFDEDEETASSGAASVLNWSTGIYIIWLGGTLLLLRRFLKSILAIRTLSRKFPRHEINGMAIYMTDQPGTPFSFFDKIYWNKNISLAEEKGQQILRHEMYHVRQHHSADIILLELVHALFWFNPFILLIRNECTAIHEFLADESASLDKEHHAYAEMLVHHAIDIKSSNISNSFFHHHIKRRIIMLTQMRNKKMSYITRLMAIPILVTLTAGFCLDTKDVHPIIQEERSPLRVVIDAGHGGDDAGAFSEDRTIKEKDLALAISKKIKMLAGAYNIEVQLTRDADVYPPLKDRPIVAEKFKADAMISIHIGAGPDKNPDGTTLDKPKGGIDIFIPANNQKQEEQSRVLGTMISSKLGTLYPVNENLLQRKNQGIWVLDQSPCPIVLVECGYITNPADLKFITNETNQEAIAKKILEGLQSYQQTKRVQKNVSRNSIEPLTK